MRRYNINNVGVRFVYLSYLQFPFIIMYLRSMQIVLIVVRFQIHSQPETLHLTTPPTGRTWRTPSPRQ